MTSSSEDHAEIRLSLLEYVYRDLLGPFGGSYEVITESPCRRYMLGVLEPHPRERQEEGVATSLESEGELTGYIDEDEVADDAAEIFFRPVPTKLDYRRRPSSMGLSFAVRVLENDPTGVMDLLITWGRYKRIETGDPVGWKRVPRSWHGEIRLSGEGNDAFYLRPDPRDGTIRSSTSREPGTEVSVRIFRRWASEGVLNVSVYVVNEIDPPRPRSSEVERCESNIFQPQIRINLRDVESVSGFLLQGRQRRRAQRSSSDPSGINEMEEGILDVIFADRAPRAKGHNCSAVWGPIDIEQYLRDCGEDAKKLMTWPDGVSLEDDLREKFTAPDLRTDFLPTILLEDPDYRWDGRFGDAPELRAAELAEAWDPQRIREMLQPLASGYEGWIRSLESRYRREDDPIREIGDYIVDYHKSILRRIERAIELIAEDPDVRLSFCFANRTLDLQKAWKDGLTSNEGNLPVGGLEWRPFQLAFILLAVESLATGDTMDVCDVLFVPTGGGKTEAYLAIAAFSLALRRRRALSRRINGTNPSGAGTGVILRYTLRLLTIQQFRRALRMITAMEYLRVWGLGRGIPVGWRPNSCNIEDDFLWGTSKFSVGLWVGGHVSPNRLLRRSSSGENGAVEILSGRRGRGEPAQVLRCPVCDSILAIPNSGLGSGSHILYIPVLVDGRLEQIPQWRYGGGGDGPRAKLRRIVRMSPHSDLHALEIEIESGDRPIRLEQIERILDNLKSRMFSSRRRRGGRSAFLRLASLSLYRPGYLPVTVRTDDGDRTIDFVMLCPNPNCDLNRDIFWAEGAPAFGIPDLSLPSGRRISPPEDGYVFKRVADHMRVEGSEGLSWRIPIPALTVDEQVYRDPPSFLLGTVDKVARLAFEPRGASIFGNVDRYSPNWGFYRSGAPPISISEHVDEGGHVDVGPFDPPELIIQDELHLIEGPLGSMVGIYETAVEALSRRNDSGPKYIASSATVKNAEDQVASVFVRKVVRFPFYGHDYSDRFFIRFVQRELTGPQAGGKLFVGISTPGLGPQYTIRRSWGVLLHAVSIAADRWRRLADPYWTLVAYFNAIRELAGARSVLRQDVMEELEILARRHHRTARSMDFESTVVELSSQVDSTELPSILDRLKKPFGGDPRALDAVDVLLTTSMFGTGIDIPRLSLMYVVGQPKTTSAYVQAVGRVGRKYPGLVMVMFRHTRPRDLSHYELFAGYHLNLERFVEPVSATPFAPTTVSRCAGPVIVAILRNMGDSHCDWIERESAHNILHCEGWHEDINRSVEEVLRRYSKQPDIKKSKNELELRDELLSDIDRWRMIAQQSHSLVFEEYFTTRFDVVLGDPLHKRRGRRVVFENAPNSLREIEEMISLDTGGG